MAQLVEQLIRNQQVAGSNPAISSKKCNRCNCGGCIFLRCKVQPYFGVSVLINVCVFCLQFDYINV